MILKYVRQIHNSSSKYIFYAIHAGETKELSTNRNVKGKARVHPCTGTEALYRPYGPQGE